MTTQTDQFNKRIEAQETRLARKIEDIEKELKESYVRNDRFDPIQKIVYGVVGLILTSVVGAVIAMVVTRPGG